MFIIIFITVSNSRSPGNFCLTEGKVGFETGTFPGTVSSKTPYHSALPSPVAMLLTRYY